MPVGLKTRHGCEAAFHSETHTHKCCQLLLLNSCCALPKIKLISCDLLASLINDTTSPQESSVTLSLLQWTCSWKPVWVRLSDRLRPLSASTSTPPGALSTGWTHKPLHIFTESTQRARILYKDEACGEARRNAKRWQFHLTISTDFTSDTSQCLLASVTV